MHDISIVGDRGFTENENPTIAHAIKRANYTWARLFECIESRGEKDFENILRA